MNCYRLWIYQALKKLGVSISSEDRSMIPSVFGDLGAGKKCHHFNSNINHYMRKRYFVVEVKKVKFSRIIIYCESIAFLTVKKPK